jgi:hypothetical protein
MCGYKVEETQKMTWGDKVKFKVFILVVFVVVYHGNIEEVNCKLMSMMI